MKLLFSLFLVFVCVGCGLGEKNALSDRPFADDLFVPVPGGGILPGPGVILPPGGSNGGNNNDNSPPSISTPNPGGTTEPPEGHIPQMFVRGDANLDGAIDISDAVVIAFEDFLVRFNPCLDAADTNDDGEVNDDDVLFLLEYLFLRDDLEIPEPHPKAGFDPTPDGIACGDVKPGSIFIAENNFEVQAPVNHFQLDGFNQVGDIDGDGQPEVASGNEKAYSIPEGTEVEFFLIDYRNGYPITVFGDPPNDKMKRKEAVEEGGIFSGDENKLLFFIGFKEKTL